MTLSDNPVNDLIVVAIDGPSGAGKGTVARQVAARLGFHFLDSGAVYRAAALGCVRAGVDLTDEQAAVDTVASLDIRFPPADAGSDRVDSSQVLLGTHDITDALRSEVAADAASRLAVLPSVREVLLPLQRRFRQAPGLVADGRDMGTVVFPAAQVKIFMTASAGIRAERRLQQLKDQGIEATLSGLMREINARDERDATREHAPMKPAADAIRIDTTTHDIDVSVTEVIDIVRRVSGNPQTVV